MKILNFLRKKKQKPEINYDLINWEARQEGYKYDQIIEDQEIDMFIINESFRLLKEENEREFKYKQMEIKLGRKIHVPPPFLVITPRVYKIYHEETAKYKDKNISKIIQDKLKELKSKM